MLLRTRRLILSEMTLDHLDFLARMLADPAVMRFWPRTYRRDEAAKWIRKNLAGSRRDGFGLWLVREKATGRPVGRVGLMRQKVVGNEVEVGWMIDRPFQRCGYATEAALACVEHAFQSLQLPQVISLIRPENLPSVGLARKLGMTRTGRVLHAGFAHDVYRMASNPPA